jgi:nitrite reductase/ring-hydroxylating ferredoxin subunit
MQSPPRHPSDDLLASLAPATDALETIADDVGALEALDTVARPVQDAVKARLGNELVRDALTGRWLGHSLHPVLTDLPIGFWTSAFTLDLIGGKRSRKASQRLVGIGVLCALPTAAAGAADWSDTTGPERRVGLVHAGLNTAALASFGATWLARRKGRHARGVFYGLDGSALATGGGFFGGHMVQRMGLAVDHTVFEELPDEWTATDPVSSWEDDEPRRVRAGGADVVVVRYRGIWYGLDARCSHAGGPLDEGGIDDGCVECPWHGSRFRLDDGSVVRGPAFTGQPVVAVRVRDDEVEVRAAS